MSRFLEDLHPLVEDKARDWLSICKSKGYDVLITNTLRTNAEQNALYAKGRTAPGSIVTNVTGGRSYHNYGLAMDFCPLVNGKCAWDRHDLFKEIASIAKSLGFTWGGDFKSFVDMPHLQMTFDLSIKDLLNGKRPPQPHWAYSLYEKYNESIGTMHEKRFDEPLKRSEYLALRVSEFEREGK